MPTRRELFELWILAGLAPIVHSSGTRLAGADAPERPMFRTGLCDLLGIDYPILQAPMQAIVTPRLVAAVGEAGGLGVLPGIGVAPDDLRKQIREVRALTRRPFGVNLILHSAIRPPVDTSTLADATVSGVQAVLNTFRARLGLAPKTDRPPTLPDLLPASFDVIVDERVPLFSTGLGLPTKEMVARCHQAGIKVMCMVATVPDARDAEALGADLIVAQGAEAGGHRSIGVKPRSPELAAIGSIALVPQIAQAVRVPVIAAGGIMDGRGVTAALMLGATGVLMGTRFIATTESAAPAFYKQALVEADSDQTTLSDAFTGHYARFLRNEYTEEYRASGAPVLPAVVQQLAGRDVVQASATQNNPAFYPLYAGQGVGLIDTVPSAGAIVGSIVQEARRAIASLPGRVRVTADA